MVQPHPLVENLPNILQSCYNYPSNFEWFPPNTVRLRALQGLHPTKLYSGAFQKWQGGWLPLIYTDDKKYPIMLVKTDGLGLWIVSTMFLASSSISILIENIIKAKTYYVIIRQYHEHYKLKRLLYASQATFISIGLLAVVFLALQFRLISLNIPFSNSFGGNFIISVLFTFMLWILGYLANFVRSSIRSALNK